MTINEARYVIANRAMYTIDTYLWALEIVDDYERQHGGRS